jgi:hypothetical protein
VVANKLAREREEEKKNGATHTFSFGFGDIPVGIVIDSKGRSYLQIRAALEAPIPKLGTKNFNGNAQTGGQETGFFIGSDIGSYHLEINKAGSSVERNLIPGLGIGSGFTILVYDPTRASNWYDNPDYNAADRGRTWQKR